MHLIGSQLLGIAMLLLLALLVVVKVAATGSMLDWPKGSLVARLADGFNLLFLLILTPLAAILLIAGRLETLDPTHVAIEPRGLLTGVEAAGLVLYLAGYALMAWALANMRRTYQVGGSAPRAADRIVMTGPYRLVRNPMYAAALCMALGLACLVQSLAYLAVFAVYLYLILRLISEEEAVLRRAYGADYEVYARRVKRLVPFIF